MSAPRSFDDLPEEELVELLRSSDETTRIRATTALWERWYAELGPDARATLHACEAMARRGELARAEAALTKQIEASPEFAEAWNRRAVLRYTMKRFREAASDCERVIALKPWHFGALHGLGLCRMAMGELGAAIAAFEGALRVQPFEGINAEFARQCRARLN